GAKMLLADVVHIPATVSLGVIVVIIATAVLLSAWQRRREAVAAARPHDLHTGCAGPAPQPAVLKGVPRPAATEGARHQDAVLAAEATARPALVQSWSSGSCRLTGLGQPPARAGGRAGGFFVSLP